MDFQKMDEIYMDLIRSNKKRYEEDYLDLQPRVENSKAIFRGEVVPFSYKPLFFNDKDVNNFKEIGAMILKIGDKIVDEYLKNPKFRKKFAFPKEIEDLILVDNGYNINVPMTRLDIFYKDRENFKFCELNTDGSSAMLEDNSFAEITLDSKAIKDLEDRFNFKSFELIDSWVEKSLKIYENWEAKTYKKPNVAILDLIECATTVEFQEFQEAYKNHGVNAKIVDPRELEYRDGNLYFGDYRIDMVYRRLVTSDMIPYINELEDFLQAYRDGKICLIGSFRSQLLHNKIIFKVLHDKESLELFTEEERDFIRKHIPYTGDFKGDRKKFKEVKENKNKYIMKPEDMNVGKGVFVGRDLDQEQWEKKLEEVWNSDYIFQEFVDPFNREFLIYRDGFEEVLFNSVVGIFMYAEEFAGLYTRLGSDNIISSVNSYRGANIIYKER